MTVGAGTHDLIRAWRRFRPEPSAPYLLDGDESLLERSWCGHRSYAAYTRSADFGERDGRLHLGLLPMPFMGNLQRASVVVLMLNPGLGHHDYYGEDRVPPYRRALLRNLRQPRSAGMCFLEPRHSWHGGFRYWNRKLTKVVQKLAGEWDVSYRRALARIAPAVAALELVPYHSARFDLSAGTVKQLRSAELARSFVHEYLLPRAKAGEVSLVVTRKAKVWRVKPARSVVVYGRSEAMGAHLTPTSRGGREILKRLRRTAAVPSN